MKRKWWVLLVGVIVVVAGLTGAGAYFFLVGRLMPPVDISGINISSALTAEELLPDQLINESLNRGTIFTGLVGLQGG